MKFIIIFMICSLASLISSSENPSFVIDFPNNQFLMNGKPFRYISGALQYFRVHEYYWKDRLLKMKAAGLNAVQTLVPWNFHEDEQGVFRFDGRRNLTRFLDLAKDVGMLVILRVGPYTSGEWENGGIPWWLLKIPNIKFRSSDPQFMYYTELWHDKLFSTIVPYLWKNGGPVGMVQLENEYGSFDTCDIVYTTFLRDHAHSYFGYDTLLFTCDGPSLAYLKCGYIPSVYPSIDNYASASAFSAQRTYAPRGPLINSEFYPGWFTAWGANYSSVPIPPILAGMSYMWSANASWNFYTFIGGTSYGYWAGSGSLPITTSYEFNAPVTEAGDLTPKYYAIRSAIKNMTKKSLPAVPSNTSKMAYGKVELSWLGSVIDLLEDLSAPNSPITSTYPLTFEQIAFPYGFVLYQTKVPGTVSQSMQHNLSCPEVNDRGYVLVNGNYQGFLMQQMGNVKNHSAVITCNIGDKIQILVENMGRSVSGHKDFKGILKNVTLDGTTLTSWQMFPIDLKNASKPTIQAVKRNTSPKNVCF